MKTKKLWNFRTGKDRGQVPAIAPVVKRVGNGLYKIGNFEPASLDEIKEFSRVKGLSLLTMGAVRIKI